MYKIFTSWVALCCFLTFAQTSTAQISFSVVPTEQQANIQIGDTVTVNLNVEEFYGIVSYQFSVNWNPSWLDFESIHSLGLPNMSLGGNFGTNNSGLGNFTTLWDAPGSNPYSLFDGDTTIFSFDMIVLTTEGINAPIQITSNPTGLEVVGLNGSGNVDDITGTVIINNGTATDGGGTGGGPTCDFGGGFGHNMSSGSGVTGDEVCLTVTTCGFTDIVSAQYSINFDPALVQFESTGNYNLPGLNSGFFNGNNSAGFITFSWLDSLGTGTTVADGTAIYDVCFTLIGAGGSVDSIKFTNNPLTIDITDVASSGSHIGFDSNPGIISITGTSSSAVTVVASEVNGPVGGQACVQVTALNWDTIVGGQYSMHWDTSVVTYASVGSFGGDLGAGDFNTPANLIEEGTLLFQYVDFGNVGFSVPNGGLLYEVCFDIVGEVGETSPFTFDGTPTNIEITQKINGIDVIVPLLTQTGQVSVVPTGSNGDLVITASTEEVCPGDTVCVAYVASNFDSLYSMEFTMTYNASALLYLPALTDNAVPELNAMQFSNPSAGNVKMIWVESGLTPISFFTDTTLFNVCFEAIGADGDASVMSYDFGSTIEVGGPDGAVPVNLVDGNVDIIACGALNISADITNVDCFGESTGAIDITVSGGAMPTYTYAWAAATGINQTAEDQTGLAAGTYSVTVTDTNSGATVDGTFTITEPTAALGLTFASTDANCNGGADGTATANATGGTINYTYLWDNNETTQTVTGLLAGEICVTITDNNGCTIEDCVTIGEGDPIEIAITVMNSECDSPTGSLTASASGGSGVFDNNDYVWNTMPAQTGTTATALAPGNYCVTVTDSNGCTEVQCADVGTLAGPSLEITNTTETTCDATLDGTITVTATGGAGNYTYVWGTPTSQTTATATGLPAGTWTVTVTDGAGCDAVISGTIMEGDGISASIDNAQTSCTTATDGILTVNTSNGSGDYDYEWDNNETTQTISGLSPGNYTVTVTDNTNGCTDTESATISAPDAVTADASVSSDYNGEDISCNGGSDGEATATGGGGAGNYTYLWSDSGSSTTQTATDLSAGTYIVTITDGNGCTETDMVTLTEPTVIAIPLTVTNEMSGGDGAVESAPTGGTPGYSYEWNNGETTQDIEDLIAGEYCVTVTDDNGCTNSACATVNGLNSLDVTLLASTPESCFGEADGQLAVMHNGTGPFGYSWSDGTTVVSTANPAVGLSAGTYSVTVTDATNTTGVLSSIILGGPTADITYTTDLTNVNCNGDATGSIGLTISGGNDASYTVAWNSGDTGSVITGLASGSYTPTITDDNGCTKVGTPIVIAEPMSMAINLVSTTDPGCNGELTGEIHIAVTGGTPPYVSYQWNGPNGPYPNSPDLTMLSAGTYSCIVTDANGCMATTGQVVLNLTGSPVITVVSSTDLNCAGDMSGAINIAVSGGDGGPYTYLWSNNGETTEDISGLSGGSYDVTVTDGNGCSTVEAAIIVNEPNPIVLSTGLVTPATSSGDDGAIDLNNPTGGTAPYTYLWSNGETTQDISNLAAATYIVTVTDANGCTASLPVSVSGNFAISNNVISSVSCAGTNDGAIDITVFGGVKFPGTDDYEYFWLETGTTSPVYVSQDLTGLGAGEYCVTVTDANGLTTTGCYMVNEPGLLTISNFNITNETGNGGNGAIDITVSGGTTPYEYQWNNGMDFQDISMLENGSYIVTVTDANGCMLISPELVVLPTPVSVVNAEATMVTCAGDTNGSYCISVFGGVESYNFTLSTGSMQNSVTGQGICFNGLASGDYMLTISDSDGSTNTPDIIQTFTITEPDPIVVTINNQSDNTGGNDCNGTINIDFTGGMAPYTFLWSNGEMSEDIDMLCSDSSPYSVTVTDSNGCTGTRAGIEIADAPFITAVTDNVTCFGDCDGSINTTVTFGAGGYTYLWSNGATTSDVFNLCPDSSYSVTVTDLAGNTSTQTYTIEQPALLVVDLVSVSPANGDNSDGAVNIDPYGGWNMYDYLWSNGSTSQDIVGVEAGSYTVTVTDMDGDGCASILQITVPANDIFLTSGTEVEEESCANVGDGFICVETEGGLLPHTYLWNVEGPDNNDPCIYGLGAGNYRVTITDATGNLSRVFTFDLEGKELLEVSFATAPSSATAIATGGTLPYSYLWNNFAMDTTMIIVDQATDEYSVVVTDANGCIASGEVEVTGPISGDCEEARTILTPNGDFANETFEILCARIYDIDLIVFNRWGQQVYEATNYQNDWTGVDSGGNPLPEGGYFYVVNFKDPEDGSDRQVKGHLTILIEE